MKTPSKPTYFASGSNNPSEIRGFARIGHALGVAAHKVNKPSEAALVELAGTDVDVFVDSGAFSEVECNTIHKCSVSKPAKKCKAGECVGTGNWLHPSHPPYEMVVVDPMTHAKWTKVIGLYKRLAKALGNQVNVVAPDCIGHQDVSLARLAKYAADMRDLKALGANILVPMQKGSLSQVEFAEAAEKALGFSDWTPSFPCNKAPTTPAELAAFIEARKPATVHLLGLGPRRNKPKGRTFADYIAAAGDTKVLHDSCLITETVGKSNGRANHCDERRGGRRVYTKAQDLAADLLAKGFPGENHQKEFGIVLAFSPLPAGADRWDTLETALAA